MIKEHFKKISKDTFLVLILNSVNYLGSFILAVLISRFLGIESLGEFTFIIAVVSLLGIVSDFGLSTLLIRKIGENKSNAKGLILNFNFIKIIFSVAVIFILILSVSIFYKHVFYSALLVGSLLIIPRSLQSTYESSLRSFLNQIYPAILKGLNSILQLTGSFILLMNGYGLVNIFILILILDTLTLLFLKIFNTKIINNYNLKYESGIRISATGFMNNSVVIIKESYVFFINNFFMLSIKGLNVILLGYFSGALSVGIYSAGARFVNGIGLFSGALFNSFYPIISNLKNDLKLKIELTKKFLVFAFAFGTILTSLFFFMSDFLINLTFKNFDSVIVLKILSFTMIPVLIYTLTQSFLFSVYNEMFLMKILIIAWSVNIILSIILIIAFNYTGCAIALTITEIFLMTTQLTKFNSDIKNFDIQKATLT